MLLECNELSVSYGKIAAVRGVSLRIAQGQIVTIVGPNGAGKSTLLSALMGLLPWAGRVAYFGKDRKPAPSTEALVRLGLGLIPENRELFAPMSIDDNLRLGAFDRWRAGARDIASSLDEVFALFPRLEERRAQPAGTLSGGERQMLAIGRALMGRPKLLMLDEPSLGLAPLIVRDIFEIIKSLRARGVSVLLIEQNARAAINISDYGYVMEAGAFVLQGSAAELANNAKVIETYLGVSGAAKAES
jgi:branched-chain amino acid transport system ATP-binding protein